MEYTYQLTKPDKKRERYIFNVSFELFFELLETNQLFRDLIINIFINSEFEYIYWQFPTYSNSTKLKNAQFDFVKATSFADANPKDFSDKFIGRSPGEIIIFKNKSGDTDLISVVPTKYIDINSTCSDIMSFMVKGHPVLKSNMLIMIGKEMVKKINPCYLSTHGKGVEWIHIRLCNGPKYYV